MLTLPKVAVVIPFYNGDHLIKACVSSILGSDHPVSKIYIIDNSTKPTKVIDFFSDSSLIKVIKTKPAIGFGRACNIGLEQAILDDNDVAIIMNQDAIFQKKAIGLLSKHALSKGTFGTVPISYTYDLQSVHPDVVSGYLRPVDGFMQDKSMGQLKSTYKLSYLQANGSCVAFHLATIKKQPWFDPVFKMYGEDTELFYRLIHIEHLALFLVPEAHIGHIHSQISNAQEKNKNNAYGRYGGQVMHLKRNQFGKFFIKTFHTYFLALKELNFKLFWLYLSSDIKLLPKLRRILRSRDKHFLSQQIKHYLDHDRA